MGLHRAGFDVTGMDNKPQPRYPFPFILADAMEVDLEGYDCYWASPPCQAYMDTNASGLKPSNHPRLIQPTRNRLQATGKPYIIENVHKAPIRPDVVLCGTMFDLRVIRHRYFELSFTPPPQYFSCYHWGTVAHGDFVGVYGRGGKGPRHGRGVREPAPRPHQVTWAEAMGIDWMSDKEMTQAIPPVYSEYLGHYLMKVC